LSATIVPIDSEIVKENNVAVDSEIITDTPFKGEAWIQSRPQPLVALVVSEKVNKNGVGADWEIITEKTSKGDARVWKRS